MLCSALCVAPLTLAQRDIGVGEVNVQRDIVPVVVRSVDGEALKILRTAFSVHGRYVAYNFKVNVRLL